ncbi:MAG: hypothetical protein N2C12_18085, partial [Planctomycetales bacterium]
MTADSTLSSETFDPYKKWLGISLKDQPPNHYRLLGIDLFEHDDDVIGNAADQRMLHVRSFQSGKDVQISQRILNEISAARVCLLDEKRRDEYDEQLRSDLASVSFALSTAAKPVETPAKSESFFSQTSVRVTLAAAGVLVAIAVLIAIFSSGDGSDDEFKLADAEKADQQDEDPAGQHPQLPVIDDLEIPELQGIKITPTINDDRSMDGYFLRLKQGPEGASINPSTSEFRWMPT